MRRCKKHGRRWCIKCVLWSGGFLAEHMLWEKAPGFSFVTHILGL